MSAAKEIEIHDPAMIRSLVYDMGISDPEAVMARLGFPQVSDEGAKMEREASNRRISRVMMALPVFMRQAAVIADVLAHEHATVAEVEIDNDFSIVPVMAAYHVVSLASIVSVLSYFLEAGVFTFSPNSTEDDDE